MYVKFQKSVVFRGAFVQEAALEKADDMSQEAR
jgi:hypothetical protein